MFLGQSRVLGSGGDRDGPAQHDRDHARRDLVRVHRTPAAQARRDRPAPVGAWSALRNTTAGFRLLHLGSAAVLILVGLVWAYGFNNDPKIVPLELLFNPDNFRFWTILHVTVSFSSR